MNNLKKTILEKIEGGEVTMRPRWHFVFKGVLLFSGVVIVAIWLIYLVSFIVFTLSTSGVILMPAFGIRGLVIFLFALPWLLILATVVFVGVLELLVKKYSFSYRKPLLYSVLGILIITAFGTLVVSQTNVHNVAMQRAHEHRLPMVGGMYTGYGLKPRENIHVGEVIRVTDHGFVINERVTGELEVVLTEQTKIPFGKTIQVGEHIIVLGSRSGDTVTAEGVKHFFGKMFKPVQQFEERVEKEMRHTLDE